MEAVAAIQHFVYSLLLLPVIEHQAVRRNSHPCAIRAVPAMHQYQAFAILDDTERLNQLPCETSFVSISMR